MERSTKSSAGNKLDKTIIFAETGYNCMKKSIAVITFFCALSQINLYAQEKPQHRLQFQAGLSGIGVIASVADRLDVAEAVEVDVTPSLQLAYDYFYSKKISLGLAFAYQDIGVTYRNYSYDEGGETITDDYGTQLRRINISARGLYWYNPESKFKLYSGLRLGFSNWSADTTVPDPTYDPDQFINIALGANFAPQIILLGTDVGLSEHWHLSAELAIGAPYFAAAGISYTW